MNSSIASVTPLKKLPVFCTQTEAMDGIIRAWEPHSSKAPNSSYTSFFYKQTSHLDISKLSGPVARFGDTAANAGILALLASNPVLRKLPSHIQTIFASLLAALFRMVLTPIDTVKTTLQAQGKPGWAILRRRIKIYGFSTLFYGAVATAAATFVGHYPWFSTVSCSARDYHTDLTMLFLLYTNIV